MATKYGYDPSVDYTKGISEAVAAGDLERAGILEAQRNEKIRGEGLSQYKTTNHYADYLPRTDQINTGMNRLANSPAWEYDLNSDPAWQALRKQYLREADRGVRDVMGAYAGQTGGVPSTAAVAAASQAGDYYRAQLADRIPDLVQTDYSRYLQGREADRADLSLLSGIEQQRQSDELARRQWEWQQQQTEQGNAYDRAMTWIQMGLMPSDADLAAAGISKARAQEAVYRAQSAAVGSRSGSGSGSRASSGGGYKSTSGGSSGSGSLGGSNSAGSRSSGNKLSYDDLLAKLRAAGSYDAAFAILTQYQDAVPVDKRAEVKTIVNRLYPSNPQLIQQN